MADSNYTTRLEALHEATVKSKDERNFFGHLYRYLEYISENSALESSPWQLFSETYTQDHDPDEYSADSGLGRFEKQFTEVLNDHRGDTRFYNCWLYLCAFYYANTLNSYGIAKLGKVPPNVEAPQNQLITAILQHEMRSAKFLLDNSGNTELKRSEFSLYLEVFHAEFKDWLAKGTVPSAPLNKRSPSENMYEAKLSFPVLATPTVICNGYEYFFTPMTEGGDPCKITTYCVDEKPNTEVSLSTLRERMNVKAEKGIAEALRKSPLLKMDKLSSGALTPFIYEVSAKTITMNPIVKLTESEFERLRNTSKRSRLISK